MVPEVLPDDVVRVEHGTDPQGNKQTIEHLVGGGRRITSEITYAFGDGELAVKDAERLAEQLMDGARSAAELVPRDSCLGSKLRNDEDVPLFTMRCDDGRLRSVRCHDRRVLERLTELAGGRAVEPPERGPIEAFVVTPLEGEGPLRVYDHRGVRRGRPRTVEDAVQVVDQLLGEAVARGGRAPGGIVVLNGHIARRGDEALLLARDAVEPYRPRHELRRHGLVVDGWARRRHRRRRPGRAHCARRTDPDPVRRIAPRRLPGGSRPPPRWCRCSSSTRPRRPPARRPRWIASSASVERFRCPFSWLPSWARRGSQGFEQQACRLRGRPSAAASSCDEPDCPLVRGRRCR